MESFGAYLRSRRESRGMTVNQLGMYSDISAATISRIENEKRGVPKADTIKKLAVALKIPYKEMMDVAGYSEEDEVVLSEEELKSKEERRYYANLIANIQDPVKKQQALAYLDFLASSPTDGAKK